MRKRQQIRKLILMISLLGFTFTCMYISPYMTVEGSTAGIVSAGMLFWIIMFAISLLSGRVYCGWFCPLGEIQDYTDKCIQKPLKRSSRLSSLRYLWWLLWVCSAAFLSIKAGGYHKIDLLFNNPTGLPPYSRGVYANIYFIIAVIILFSLVYGKRGFCHNFCFLMPMLTFGKRLRKHLKYPFLHLTVKPQNCTSCKLCDQTCPMSIEVASHVKQNDLSNLECIMCGSCVDVCPVKAIRFSWDIKDDIKINKN